MTGYRGAAVALVAMATHPLFALTLAEDGRPRCQIVIAEDAIASERTAAADLADVLQQVTGATFEIRSPSDVPADAPQILVGQSERASALLPDVGWGALKADSIIIRTAGDRLILSGGRPRGALYAVNTFLEDKVGCRWWTSTESTIPDKPRLVVDEMDIAYTPALMSREVFFKDAFESVFATRLKVNGHFADVPEERGGHIELIGWCHTFWPLLPPEEHFADHPEWYSEIDGKRSAEGTQICLTNEDARRELTKNVLALLRENPGARLISVSQNDWGGRCQCAPCRTVEEEEGSPSGPVIRFVNAVAEEVEREFPDVLVETLAYSYTRHAPAKVRPRHNVVVRLCSIECDFSRPLSSDENADFRRDIEAWSAMADNLYIWNYVVNFANFLYPHPNLRSIGDDVRYFMEHGAVSIFEQGDAYARGGDLNELRAWVMAHVLWDPRLDSDALIREFVEGYYGPAAPHVLQYLDVIHDAVDESHTRLTCFLAGTEGWFGPPAINEATRALDDALGAVAGDAELSARVRRMRLPLEHVRLLRYADLKREAALTGDPFLGPEDLAAGYEQFVAALTEFGTGFYGEGRSLDSYLPLLQRRCVPARPAAPPEECAGLSERDWLDVQETSFSLAGYGTWVELVDDPSASDGGATRMPGGIPEWATQWPVPGDTLAEQQWRVHVVVRCDPAGKDGTAFQIGLYDGAKGTGVAQLAVPIADAKDGAYRAYDLGVHRLTQGVYVWIAPPADAEVVKNVYVDRVFLVRVPE